MPLSYLYEPNHFSILKAGTFNTVGHRFDVKKLHTNTHLYTSENKLDHFPGRMFEILPKVVRLVLRQIRAVAGSKQT